MTTYYVDPDDAGTNVGTQANPWQSIQDAIDGSGGSTLVAGDEVLCMHGTGDDEDLSAIIDVDPTNQGTVATGYISFIGVNGSWANDGTKYIIDAQDSLANCIRTQTAAKDLILWENFEFKRATGDGVGISQLGSDCDGWLFINCSSHDHGGDGFGGFRNNNGRYILCTSYNNTGDGFTIDSGSMLFFCSSHSNSGHGVINAGLSGYSIGCLYYDNTLDDINDFERGSIIYNNILDNPTDDCLLVVAGLSSVPTVIGNRITNAGDIGIDYSGDVVIEGWNYFQSNSTNEANNSLIKSLLYNGVATTLKDQGDTDEGYENKAGDNYNLASDATLRRTVISIPTS